MKTILCTARWIAVSGLLLLAEKTVGQLSLSAQMGPSLARLVHGNTRERDYGEQIRAGVDAGVSLEKGMGKRLTCSAGLQWSRRSYFLREYYGGQGAGCTVHGNFWVDYVLLPVGLRFKVVRGLGIGLDTRPGFRIASQSADLTRKCFYPNVSSSGQILGFIYTTEQLRTARGVLSPFDLACAAHLRYDLNRWFVQVGLARGIRRLTEKEEARDSLNSISTWLAFGYKIWQPKSNDN